MKNMKPYDKLFLTMVGKTSKKIAHATTLRREGVQLVVKFHETDILVLAPNGTIQVNSGGWRTPLTKERIHEFGGILIHSVEDIWFVKGKRGALSHYYDGMAFDEKGIPETPRTETFKSVMSRKHALDRATRTYRKGFMAALKKQVDEGGAFRRPSSGDCWYCHLFGDPGVDHVLRHMEQDYFVPSLLFNAFTEHAGGTSWQSGRPKEEEVQKRVGLRWQMSESDLRRDHSAWMVERALRAYFTKRKWKLLEEFDVKAFKEARAEHLKAEKEINE